MASSLSVVHSTTFRHLLSMTFFRSRPLSSATSAVSFYFLFSSSSTAAMTSPSKKTMKSTSSQINTTFTSNNAHSLKAAVFKTLALQTSCTKIWQRIKQWKNCSFNPPFFLQNHVQHIPTLPKTDPI